MRSFFAVGLLLCTASGLAEAPVRAEMYTWTDREGQMHFSDNPPEHGPAKVLTQPGQCYLETLLEGLGQEQRDQLFNVQRQKQGLAPGTIDLEQDGLDGDQKQIVRTLIHEGQKCKAGNKQACRCLDRAQEAQSGLRSYTPTGMFQSKSSQPTQDRPSAR